MTARRAVAATLVGLGLAGCGSSSPTDQPAAEAPAAESPASEAPAVSPPIPGEAPSDGTSDALPPTTTLADAANRAATDAIDADATDATGEAEPTASVTTTVPAEPEPAIVDACSTDGSPTALAVADGPVPELAVVEAAASSGSPLPDLAVRRINCGGGWMQLRNEIPADRPLLIWFWAPH